MKKCENDPEFLRRWFERCGGFEPRPFDSWHDLVRSIADRSTWSKDNLYLKPFEDPQNLTLGFKCINTGEVWRIRVHELGKDVRSNPQLRGVLNSSEGRSKLAADFTQGLFDPQLVGDLTEVWTMTP